jgi:pyroglutamyl-peptidase
MPVILVTGFGRFPGAPINPTAALVARLERSRRPALADLRIATHVFATRYAAVDHELPALLAREKPDAILLFGVATKTKRLRLELIARNRASVLLPDAGGVKPATTMIARGGPSWRVGQFSPQRLLAAARSAGIRPTLSRNAGAYLCNYAYWRALEAARAGGPRVVAFVHISPLCLKARPRRAQRERQTEGMHALARLTRVSETMLIAIRVMLRDTTATRSLQLMGAEAADRISLNS